MDKIESFLINYNAKATIKLYRCALKQFFETINKNPNTYINKNKNYESYEEDIKLFHKAIYHHTPRTITNYIMGVKMFLEEYKIYLDKHFWKKLKKRGKGNKPVTHDIIPTVSTVKKILLYSNLMERTIILILLSSGIRIGELLQLNKNHIDDTKTPTTIYIPASIAKEKQVRITFISKEATECLKEWYNERDNYIETTFKKVNFPNVTKTPLNKTTIFPIEYETIRSRFIKLLHKTQNAERDPESNNYKLHLHSFRKYLRTHLPTVIPLDVVYELIGHEGYLSKNYVRYTEDQLREHYLKGEHILLVFEQPQQDTTDLQNKLTNQDIKIEELRNIVGHLLHDYLTVEPNDKTYLRARKMYKNLELKNTLKPLK